MEATFFTNNRQRLAELVDGAPIILTAFSAMQRVGDESWRFEQEANFWYLTGIEEADWQLVINDGRSILIAPEVSAVSQIFNEHLSFEMAQAASGVDRVVSRKEGIGYVANLSKQYDTVCTILPRNQVDHEFVLNPSQARLAAKLKKTFRKVSDVRSTVHKLRAIKQKPEIMMMRRAINLTRSAFEAAKGELENYTFEYEVQARFSYEFERAGATHAYDPIVAGGANAVTLHYNSNRSGLKQGELVLVDIGARYGGYSADITRTYAFHEATERQRAVHATVKQAKDQIIDLIQPGGSVRQYLIDSDEIMLQALLSLNLHKGPDDFRRYYPHAVSHGLGIETHDPLGGAETFQPGMVLTVEPGIYIPEESIGVRLEDDILVTDSSTENLSRGLSDDF